MPYVKQNDRDFIDPGVVALAQRIPVGDPGCLNYALTRVILAWLGKDARYVDFNAAIGALECVKLELYRRAVAPYEDRKIAQNGDVYP